MVKKTLLSSILLASSAVSASPWMPWENNNNSNNSGIMDVWNPFGNGSTNWNPMDTRSNFGPFDSSSKFNPFDGGSNFGPFNVDQNWGPMNHINDMVNDSDWGFYYNNKNSTTNKGYARADSKYATKLETRGVGYTDSYYQGQLDGYGKARGNGRFEGYGQKGFLGFTPTNSNSFPAPGY
ncbi:Prion protein [uncultured Candidatus Thioglobus sp.]|nr:Prion protein [uncultured Candidatus Thioglobus sp.]